jgi:hypothetical protein
MLLAIPLVLVMIQRILLSSRPQRRFLLGFSGVAFTLPLAAGAWMAYYDWNVYGNPLTPPYSINRSTYAVAPYWLWQQPSRVPDYRHKAIRDFYVNYELPYAQKLRKPSGFVIETIFLKPLRAILFFTGLALSPCMVMLPRALQDKRLQLLTICALFVSSGVMLETWFIPHYLAAITAAIYALGLQAMRHLNVWKPGGQPAGRSLMRAMICLCLVLIPLRLFAAPLHLTLAEWPGSGWTSQWYGASYLGTDRARIQSILERLPGKQLVMVRYSQEHSPLDEWVYNAPDIDSSQVIWAREANPQSDSELFRYYSDRHLWLVQPDAPVAQQLQPIEPALSRADTQK